MPSSRVYFSALCFQREERESYAQLEGTCCIQSDSPCPSPSPPPASPADQDQHHQRCLQQEHQRHPQRHLHHPQHHLSITSSITSSITTKTTLGQWPLAVARLTPVSGQALPRWDLPAVPSGVTSHEAVHSTFSTSPRWRSEKAMAPHSSTLAWKIPWMEEPGGLQSMGSLRVGHD